MHKITRNIKIVDPRNLIFEKIYPRIDPKKQDTINPEPTSTRLFNSGLLRYSRDSSKGVIVGSCGGVIGVVRITSFEVFSAVIIQLQRGRRLENCIKD